MSHLVPNIKKQLPESACLVLGKAFLWLICGAALDQYVPGDLKQKVLSEWDEMHGPGDCVDAKLNPIKEMLALVVSGDHGAVYFDMVGNLEE